MPAHSASASASATMCYCYYRRESGITSAKGKAAIIKAETVRFSKTNVNYLARTRLSSTCTYVHPHVIAIRIRATEPYSADMVIRSGEYSEYKYEYSPT